MATHNSHKPICLMVLFGMLIGTWQPVPTAHAGEGLYRKTISYQSKNDLFYNFYEGPNPSGATAGMYVSPLPLPAHVGHTYFTYQPLMPHEYLYRHTRSHYSYQPCAGWTRAKVRYRTYGLRFDDLWHHLHSCCCH